MLFNSLDFLLFLAAVLILLWRAPHRVQNAILLAASCFFYAYWDWRFLGLLFFTAILDFCIALQIERSSEDRTRRRWLTCSIVSNLSVLGFFKYANFFVDSVRTGLASLGWNASPGTLAIILPVGISFFTFQAMSYTIDVYRRRMPACGSFRDFLLYITFFPQLVAGPIERAMDLLPQLRAPRKVTRADFAEGLYLVLWGYAKKVVVADNLALKVDRIFAQGSFTTTDVLLGMIGFAFQIYADFSGYTDIARGVARWLGVRLTINFDHPYFAANPQDFWRRWHISLSTWLREYVYIPLGGNRLGGGRTYVNLMTTMLLGGLWHGAAWHFVLWGGYQGLLLSGHRLWSAHVGSRLPAPRTRLTARAWRLAGTALTFALVLYGWLLFRVDSMAQLQAMSSALADFTIPANSPAQFLKLLPYIGLILAVDLVTFLKRDPYYIARRSPWITIPFYMALLYAIVLLGVTGGEQFIYFAF